MDIAELRKLAGIGGAHQKEINKGSNVSLTGMEKADLMRKHNIKPGTDEWFKLFFGK